MPKYITKTYPTEQLKEWGLPYEIYDESCPFQIIEDKFVDTSRWSSIHKLVVIDENGDLWETSYSRGATEYQDERPWEWNDTVTFTQVIRDTKEVTVSLNGGNSYSYLEAYWRPLENE